MTQIKHIILVLSGKGGVGKSSIAVNLAVWLSMNEKKVGLLDVDIHGPSTPNLLNLQNQKLTGKDNKILPVEYSDSLKLISVAFMLQNEDNALIWRGPMKHNVIKQFITDVEWGLLDFLIIDCPPGTGDEPLSVVQLLQETKNQKQPDKSQPDNLDGAVVVTTPQKLSLIDVRKCITFCRQLNLPVIGVIENMSGFVCPNCGEKTDILKSGGGKNMAAQMNVPFLGTIPIDQKFAQACDEGKPFIYHYQQEPTAKAFNQVFNQIIEPEKSGKNEQKLNSNTKETNTMRIAIPLTEGKLSLHFGHCQQFAIIDADTESKEIKNQQLEQPPSHQPGVLPKWLSELNVQVIIAGGMGQRAQDLFTENNIDVIIGAPDSTPENLVKEYLAGQLKTGQNICDH